MAHQQAPGCHPGISHHQVPHLAVHLFEGAAGHFGVVFRLAEVGGHPRVPEFEIRHIDVHHPVQQAQGLHRVVAAGIVNQGQVQAAGD